MILALVALALLILAGAACILRAVPWESTDVEPRHYDKD